tara:strand:- start:65 stop:328 length:264 start_codon:yes stop_codon:yes gene_type:complete
MAFKMKYKNLKDVIKELKGAVVAHGKQAEVIEKHVDEMDQSSPLEKSKGLWHNIRAKRKRVGKKGMSKKGTKAHSKAVKAAKEINKK